MLPFNNAICAWDDGVYALICVQCVGCVACTCQMGWIVALHAAKGGRRGLCVKMRGSRGLYMNVWLRATATTNDTIT